MAADFDSRAAILDGLWSDVDAEAIVAISDDLLSRSRPRLLAIVFEDKSGQACTPLAYLKVLGEETLQRIYNSARNSDDAPPKCGASTVYLQLLAPDGNQVVETTAISREKAARLLIQAAMASRQPGRFVATMLAAAPDTVIEHFQNNPIPKPCTGPEPSEPR